MDGMLGFLFPRKSKLLLEYIAACRKGEASVFIEQHQNDVPKLLKEIDALKIDKQEQHVMAEYKKQMEDASYPLGFSDD